MAFRINKQVQQGYKIHEQHKRCILYTYNECFKNEAKKTMSQSTNQNKIIKNRIK